MCGSSEKTDDTKILIIDQSRGGTILRKFSVQISKNIKYMNM